MNDFNQKIVLATGTTYSDPYQLGAEAGHVDTSVNVSAISGSGASLAVTVQISQDKVTWEDRNAYAPMLTTGIRKERLNEPKTFLRFKMVLTGSTPAATVDLYALGREGEGDASELATLQDAVSATGNGNSLDVKGQSSAVLSIVGTFVGILTFEATVDGTNWFSVFAVKVGNGAIASTASTTGLYRIACSGYTSIRARVSTWTSGTSVTVKARTTQHSSGIDDAMFTLLLEKLGGEDISRNLMKTMEDFNPTRITTATTTLCHSGVGTVGGIFVEVALTGTVTCYDALTAVGTPPVILPIGTPAGWHRLPGLVGTGFTVVTSAADRIVVFTKA